MDIQKPGPRGRSSSINPGPGAAVECKTPGVAQGEECWCLELTDALHIVCKFVKWFRDLGPTFC